MKINLYFNKLFLFVGLLLSSCATGVPTEKIDFSYAFCDGNSKVWMLQKVRNGDVIVEENLDLGGEFLIFYLSGKVLKGNLKDISEQKGIGFEEHDSHGVSKGPLTLLPADCHPARPRDWRRWADVTLVARAIVQQRRDASTEAALRWLCAEAYDHGAVVAEGALRCMLGGLLGSVGRLDEAAAEAEAARACASCLPQAWLLDASCACERSDWDRADAAMRTAARLLFASEASPSCTPPPSDTARAALTIASRPAVASLGDGQGERMRAELVRLKLLDRERRALHGELLESCSP